MANKTRDAFLGVLLFLAGLLMADGAQAMLTPRIPFAYGAWFLICMLPFLGYARASGIIRWNHGVLAWMISVAVILGYLESRISGPVLFNPAKLGGLVISVYLFTVTQLRPRRPPQAPMR